MRAIRMVDAGRKEFVARFGSVYEHSPWVAESVYDHGFDSDSFDKLPQRMVATVNDAGDERQLVLLRAHPDLAGRLALRPTEVALCLGVSERLVRQILPELPHVHIGTAVVIPVSDLREWLSKRSLAERKQEKDEAQAIARSLLDPST